ncbi:unnamed protein product [Urochloa decumbens]|uniref:Uncharacterized protein n=1 Tax=Urochloa decumbens TaxID=240449 RepID=A0ABC8WJW1_9POAL
MGFESISPLPEDRVVDKSEAETSQVMICDSTVTEKVEKSLSEEPFLLVLLGNKEDSESLSKTCDHENIVEAITPRGDTLELSISREVLDDSLSLGCETPRESIFDPFAPGPDVAAWAPKKQVIRGAEVPSRRKLNFDSDGPLDRQEESEKILYDGCKTPDSKPLLTGIASTCPDAPLRTSRKVSKLSPSICRKIDFDAVSD